MVVYDIVRGSFQQAISRRPYNGFSLKTTFGKSTDSAITFVEMVF